MKPSKKREAVEQAFLERFGIPPIVFEGYEMYDGSKGRIFLCTKTKQEYTIVGVTIARLSADVKPTTHALQMFGEHITKNIVSVTKEEAIRYVEGRDLEVDTSAEEGYVAVKYGAFVLGCGLLNGHHLKCQIPKAKRIRLDYL